MLTSRADRLKSRYYLKPYILHLKNSGYTHDEIEKTFGFSKTITKSALNSPINDANGLLDELFGEEDDEFLRLKSVNVCKAFLSGRGWQIGESDAKCVYDLFAVKNSKFIKIQVKSSKILTESNWPEFRTTKMAVNTQRVERRSYELGDFDYWFFYHKNGDSWIVPFDKIEARTVVTMEGYDDYYIGTMAESGLLRLS